MQGEKQQILPSKIIETDTFFKNFFRVVNSSPWIWDIKEQSVSSNKFILQLKSILDNISPGWSDICFS